MSKEELEVTDLNVEDESKDIEGNGVVSVDENSPIDEDAFVEKKRKRANVMSMILVCIGVLCIGIALYGLYGIYKEYKEADDIYKQVEDEFVQIHIPEEETTEIAGTEVEVPKGPWYELASVDLEGLQKKYPDVIGWIFFEDGSISYPVMQGDDNDYYLHTTYDGRESKSGSIFMETTHSSDFSNTHTIIYGHNMKNLSMFGSLKLYKTQAGYYDEHAYFQIFRGDEILRYQIFSYQDISVESFVYQEYFTSAKELSNRLLKTSYINPGLSISEDDKIITLSTCNGNDAKRFVVSAVLIEKYSLTDKTITEE